jgi:hypothetical protein
MVSAMSSFFGDTPTPKVFQISVPLETKVQACMGRMLRDPIRFARALQLMRRSDLLQSLNSLQPHFLLYIQNFGPRQETSACGCAPDPGVALRFV